jgi:hypothetical protein
MSKKQKLFRFDDEWISRNTIDQEEAKMGSMEVVTEPSRACKNCEWAECIPAGPTFTRTTCHRYPAQRNENEYSDWPRVVPDDWCGEFKEKL